MNPLWIARNITTYTCNTHIIRHSDGNWKKVAFPARTKLSTKRITTRWKLRSASTRFWSGNCKEYTLHIPSYMNAFETHERAQTLITVIFIVSEFRRFNVTYHSTAKIGLRCLLAGMASSYNLKRCIEHIVAIYSIFDWWQSSCLKKLKQIVIDTKIEHKKNIFRSDKK